MPTTQQIRAAIEATLDDIVGTEGVTPSPEFRAGFIGGALYGVAGNHAEFDTDADEGTAAHDAFMFGRWAAMKYRANINAKIHALAAPGLASDEQKQEAVKRVH